MKQVYRKEFRGQKKSGISEELFLKGIEECKKRIRQLQSEGRLMSAAMYYYRESVFLYYEAVEEADPEDGKPLNEIVKPEDFCGGVEAFLKLWPEMSGDTVWASMYEVFYHTRPVGEEEWKRRSVPEGRKGRIAFLKPEMLFEYVYYHKALTDEGLLKGDKYQFISLHENLLFSYFEEPRSSVNWRNSDEPSQIIEQWLEHNPDAHFIPHEENGKGFLILPEYFAMGIEDIQSESV